MTGVFVLPIQLEYPVALRPNEVHPDACQPPEAHRLCIAPKTE